MLVRRRRVVPPAQSPAAPGRRRTRRRGPSDWAPSSARRTRRVGSGVSAAACSRNAAAAATPPWAQRAAGRPLELRGHRLVRVRGRASAMPGAAIGIDVRIGDVGERPVHLPPSRQASPTGRRPTGRGGAGTGPGRAARSGRPPRRRSPLPVGCRAAARRATAAERRRPVRRPPPGAAVGTAAASGVSWRRNPCSRRWTRGVAPAALDRAERQLGRRQPPRQLQERERVAVALGQDAVPDPAESSAPGTDVSRSSPASRLLRPVHPKLRQPGQDGFLVGLPRTAKTMATGSTPRRRATNSSVCVDARSSHWASSTTQISGSSSATSTEQGQDGQAHEEAVGRAARPQPEGRRRARRAAGSGSRSSRSRYGPAELVQAGVGELHLRLDAGGPADPAARRVVEEELEQRRLADPGLAAQHQDLAPARLRGGDEAAQRLAFASSSQQTRP